MARTVKPGPRHFRRCGAAPARTRRAAGRPRSDACGRSPPPAPRGCRAACQKRSRSRTSAANSSESSTARGALDVEADLAGQRAAARRARRGSRRGCGTRASRACFRARCFPAFEPGPVQQAMRVERVPDPRPLAELEADRGAALAQDGARLRASCSGGRPYLRAQVLGRVLALGRHRRVELERLEVQLHRQIASPIRFERASSEFRPTAHQGQATSETKSIAHADGAFCHVRDRSLYRGVVRGPSLECSAPFSEPLLLPRCHPASSASAARGSTT